jgi:sugar phosphate isomerase/epimerase
MTFLLNRRQALLTGALAVGTVASSVAAAPRRSKRTEQEPFGYCFNTSTVRGQKLALDEQVELTARAGYDAIEPWLRDIQAFVDNGGNLDKIKSRIEELGITVESAIGFANWIVDDDQKRAEGLETARHDMKLVKAIGGTRIAAPPVGATNQEDLDLFKAATRYRDLLEVGKEEGVTPQLELWGFSKSISRLGELMFVAVESGHPDACILLDIYHIYKGGSDFQGLELINSSRIHVFHVNDYPADPPRESISDADRVYMGDGVAPTSMILQTIYRNGFRGMLSLELFNRTYWQQDALEVARTGLKKMRATVRTAMDNQGTR